MQSSESIEARYANYFQAGQNAMEFIIDFGQLYSDEAIPFLHTRIITSPMYARKLVDLLEESLAQHEAQFGKIRDE
jgi:Protein of unknown function (DUF3467)